jgi:hypothetical protein
MQRVAQRAWALAGRQQPGGGQGRRVGAMCAWPRRARRPRERPQGARAPRAALRRAAVPAARPRRARPVPPSDAPAGAHANAARPPAGGWGAAAAWQQQRRGFAITPDSGSDTHDDFKPKYSAPPAGDVDAQIKEDIGSNKVFIYMKVRAAAAPGGSAQPCA